MHTHANARLTQKGRLRLVSGNRNDHRPLAELAAEAGISLRCAYKWLARYRSAGPASLPIDAVFAAASGGRSIHSITSAPSTSAMSAAR